MANSGALLQPFSDPAKPHDQFIKVVKAEGTTLWDANGKKYLDGMASLWYCQVGHGRSEMVEAITKQLMATDAYHVFDPFINQPAIDVADAIIARSPYDTGRVFLGCSGSEAIDTAFKLIRLVQRVRGHEDKQIVIRRTRGYHGTNVGGTSAQGIESNRVGWGDLVPHFIEVDPDDVEDAARVFAEHGDRIAGVITEPIQGAGGVYPPPEGYLEGLRKLCTKHGAILCFDEVIAGFARTGDWFGAQTYGVTPDMFTFAKGVSSGYQPLSGVAIGPEVSAALEGMGAMLRHGYTYSGHPAACAAGLKNIELIEEWGLIERANHIGELFKSGFQSLVDDGAILSYRGVGAIWAAILPYEAAEVRVRMLDRGVVVRPILDAVAFCPPLTSTDEEIGQMIDVMADSLNK
ncbi:MAG: aspartate aminotransferase family protein [Acidimicrobiales bacterium]|nr:aspartate aminotransferase family protein [Acidimicrobiales bacterium]